MIALRLFERFAIALTRSPYGSVRWCGMACWRTAQPAHRYHIRHLPRRP